MDELTIHVAYIDEELNRTTTAWGIATRFGFELRWNAIQDTPDDGWEVVIPPGQEDAETPLFELVTGDDMRAFSRVVNQALQRI